MSKMHLHIYIYPTTIRKQILFEVIIILNWKQMNTMKTIILNDDSR